MSKPNVTSPPLEEKTNVLHSELAPHHYTDDIKKIDMLEEEQDVYKSRYDDMPLGKTLVLFKWSAIYTLLVYTGYMCEGFELGAGGSIIANKGFVAQFGNNTNGDVRGLDPIWVSTWGALLNGCAFLNFAKSPPIWALGKLCNGAGIGVLQVVCQIYVAEIAPNRIRGGMVTFQAVWSQIGGIIVAVMMQRLNANHPDNYLIAMRVLWAPITLMLLCWAVVPESPWWQARKGNKKGALRSLRRLYGTIEGYDFEEEYSFIERTLKHEMSLLSCGQPRYRDVLKGVNLKRTLTGLLLGTVVQFAGNSIIGTYSTYFFSLAGLKDPFLGTLILSICNLVAVTAWSLTADRVGRRLTVNICQTVCVVVLFVVGSLYYANVTNGSVSGGTALLVICCIWTMAKYVTAMAYYLYSAELPSAVLRTKTGPITFLSNSLRGIGAAYATPTLLLRLSLRAAYVYGAFSAPICVLMWLYVPETKGRSPAEIDELYERKIPAWRWHKTVTRAEERTAAVRGRADGGKAEHA